MSVRGTSVALGLALAAFVSAGVRAECKLEKLAELPVTMSGLRPMVSGAINGKPASFIADSGAFYSLISPSVARADGLALAMLPPTFHLRGIGGETSASTTVVKNFGLAALSLPNVEFIVGGSDTGTAGLLGQNVLGVADVEYDLPDGVIRLMRARDCGHAINLAYWAKGGTFSILKIEPRSPANPHTIGTVLLNGVKLRAAFDTGAATSVLSLRAAARAGVKPGDAGVEKAGFSRGLGQKVNQTWIGPFASFKIGDEEIQRAKLRFGDIGLEDVDMLIGADFFISHRLYVANGQHEIYFTYTGGRVFNLTAQRAGDEQAAAPTQDDAQTPTDAEGFSRRGAVYATQHDLPHAIEDFTKAMTLAPHEPRYALQRAHAYLANRQPFLAMTDFDTAIAADPANTSALLDRAQLHLAGRDRERALADLDAAAKALPNPADERLRIAELYATLDRYDLAIAQADLWIAVHREDSRLSTGYNVRCRARAFLGTDLPKALSDCNAALRLRPHIAAFLDSRGLVELRTGAFDRAITDYDEAITLAPKTAWPLYGRGLAELHKGMGAQAETDIAAAKAIAPAIAARAKAAGIG